MTQYHKLVRDKIPDIIRARGVAAKFHVADDAEYWKKLKEKLHEEVAEFCEAENAEELADVLEVIDAIIEYTHADRKEIERIKQKKAQDRGIFEGKIILEES